MQARSWILGIAVVLLAASALAQDGERGGRRRGGEGRPGGPPRGEMALGTTAARLAERLELDAAQRARFDEIVARYTAKWDAQEPGRMRELMEDLRTARQGGDEARVAEIQAELHALREARQALLNQFYDAVRPILSPEQAERLDAFRQRGPGGWDLDADGPRGPMRLIRELPEKLQLTGDQRAQFERIVAKHREDMRAQWEQLRPLTQQLREARRAGDEAKAAELAEQIRAKRTAAGESFYTELEAILTDAQKAKLADLRIEAGETLRSGTGLDVRRIVRAAQRVGLTAEQSEQVKQLAREAAKNARDRQIGPEAASRQLVEAIKRTLKPEQVAEFDRALKELAADPRASRPPAGGRGERGRPAR
mgnify:CR=1 FL=1